ncbi:MAG: UDP-N-acetylmuramate dehydrogenase [Candidatus Eisenbacteria bacterium]
MTDVFEKIEGITGVAARGNELLSLHTTFGVGGPCDLMVWVSTEEALKEVLAAAQAGGLPTFVLGRGSNLLVRDGGISGVVLRLVEELAGIDVTGLGIRAGGGASLGEVVSRATSAGIGGLEFLAGIPGTVGGAAVANAGARDIWFGHYLAELTILGSDLETVRLSADELKFGYRTSSLAPDWIVIEAVLSGAAASVEEVRQKVETSLERRRRTQPVGERSAGCIFKNPSGDSAGRLIESAGLKGLTVGGAQVSPVHANFIVNTGGATAREILDLVARIKDRVKVLNGVELELEVSVVGKD